LKKNSGFALVGVLVVAAAVAVLGLALASCALAGGSSDPAMGSVFAKIWVVVRHNIGFWVAIALAVVFGLFRKVTNPGTFAWIELPIQLLGSTLLIFILFYVFFSTTANIKDTEIWNSYVVSAEYYEEWTELVPRQVCVATDKDGNCTAYTTVYDHVYHGPEWRLITSTGETKGIAQRTYRRYVQHWNYEKKKDLFRSGQVSVGDGNMFFTVFPQREPEKIVPAAIEHDYVNYLQGSQSIKKRAGSTKLFEKFLRPYPRVATGEFGHIELDRVMLAADITPEMRAWAFGLDKKLDNVAAVLGPSKQVNVLVYLVGTSDQSFLHALEERWCFGKKNDVVVLIGTSRFPVIDWVSVMSWTEIEEFKISLRDRVVALKELTAENAPAMAGIIVEEIAKPPAQGGFQRKRMRDLEYLVSDITLPWWSQLIIVVLAVAGSWGLSYWIVKNEISDSSTLFSTLNPKNRRRNVR